MTNITSSNLTALTEYLAAYILEEIGETPISTPVFEKIQQMMEKTIKSGIDSFCRGASPTGSYYELKLTADHAGQDKPNQQQYPARIHIIWHWEDVQGQRPDLTEAQCCEVLSKLKRQHDATVGINWEVIDAVANGIFPEPDNLDELRDLYNQRYD